jgi:hypothetical protein
MAFEIGGPQFGLNDCKIALWTAAGTYSTAVDVMSVQMLGAVMQVVSADLTGDDQITATASRAISGTVSLRFGAISIAALEVLIGNTATSSVASPNNIKNLRVNGSDNMPYVGIVGRAIAEEGSGDTVIYIPKCRIMGDLNIAQLSYGEFAIPQVELRAVHDASYGVINVITRETASSTLTLPPVNIPVNS